MKELRSCNKTKLKLQVNYGQKFNYSCEKCPDIFPLSDNAEVLSHCCRHQINALIYTSEFMFELSSFKMLNYSLQPYILPPCSLNNSCAVKILLSAMVHFPHLEYTPH